MPSVPINALEDFMGEEVVDKEGNPVGTFACYWEREEKSALLLGVDLPGQSGHTHIVPAQGARFNERQSYVQVLFPKEKIAAAPSLECGCEMDDAFETLTTALQISGNSPDVRELLEDVELDKQKHNIELGKAKAAKSNDPTMRENIAALAQDMLKREIEIFSARVERYPKDMNRKYELAIRFMRVQKWSLAIPLLQQASQDPRLKGKALLKLGMCFIYDKKLPLARGQLERAAPDMDFNNDPDSFKECHYWLGRVLEQLGDKAGAEKHYGDVVVVDYDYKDTTKRLEDIQGGPSSDAALE